MILASVRLVLVLLWSLAAMAAALCAVVLTLGAERARARIGPCLMQGYSRGLCTILGVAVRTDGTPPAAAASFVAPNHWGYLDVFVLASIYRGLFVSRADVADWPVVGWFARAGGTLFIRRESRRDARRVVSEIERRLRAGGRVTAFLEGGAGQGVVVRPFKSPLVQAAVAAQVPCVPAAIRYRLPRSPGIDPVATVAWIDGGFGAHLWRLMGVPRIDAHVVFGAPRIGADRKPLARGLEDDVRAAVASA